ncbi:MAG: hypothetical protein H7Z41_15440 [Cytophagales bacterium]|nr:hypothetical protein [Armatimonadota bacterium]
MIVQKRFYFRGLLNHIGTEVALYGFLAVVVTVLYKVQNVSAIALSAAPLTLIGTALTILYGFRTNSAYDRWWEARILWGAIVNQSRTMARQALAFPMTASDPDKSAMGKEISPWQREMIYCQIAFVNALRCRLRKQETLTEIAPFLSADLMETVRNAKNIPIAILNHMATRLKDAAREGQLDPFRFVAMNQTLAELTDLQGGCERIKNTPFPRQYETFPRLFVYIYCAVLPFGLIKDTGWYTPLLSTVLSFIFIALDAIGTNIESPFENTIHDTPLTSLCRTIEIDLRQMLGEQDLPDETKPVHGFLY